MPPKIIETALDDTSREATEIAQHAATEALMTLHRVCGTLPFMAREIAFGAASALLQARLEDLLKDTPPEGIPAGLPHTLMVQAYKASLASIREGGDGKAKVVIDLTGKEQG